MTHSSLPLTFAKIARLGPVLVLSGVTAEDDAGRIGDGAGGDPDVGAQTRAALARAEATLRDAGSRLADAASVVVYLKRASDFAAMNAAYASHWTTDPPARTTIVCGLRHPDALVELAVTAVPTGAPRTAVHPEGWLPSPNPYSYGILAGDTLLLSGLVARNGRDNSLVSGNVATQTRAALENGGVILAAAGMSFRDVVSARVFITDAVNFGAMNEAYRSFFNQDPPARATVVTPLTNPNYLVEITLIAVRDPGKRAIPFDGLALPLSAAVETTGRAFFSGALDESEAKDAVGQTRGMIAEIEETLRAAQLSWADTREAIVYLTDMSQCDAVAAELDRVLAGTAVSGIFLETGLVKAGAIVEVMITTAR
jgi:2-iminobutanoate/2-iminopropanoate deaminase